jgi:putative endonuclease
VTAVAVGAAAESAAADHLEQLGYRIIARNYRARHFEIDLIAEDRGVLCFIEVRARSRRDFGDAAETVGLRKRTRLILAASYWLAANRAADRPCRFDVVGVDLSCKPPAFTLIKDAFQS